MPRSTTIIQQRQQRADGDLSRWVSLASQSLDQAMEESCRGAKMTQRIDPALLIAAALLAFLVVVLAGCDNKHRAHKNVETQHKTTPCKAKSIGGDGYDILLLCEDGSVWTKYVHEYEWEMVSEADK
jgi:hypothetical protein